MSERIAIKLRPAFADPDLRSSEPDLSTIARGSGYLLVRWSVRAKRSFDVRSLVVAAVGGYFTLNA